MINPDMSSWKALGVDDSGVEIVKVSPYGSKSSTFYTQMYSVRIKPSSALSFDDVYVWFCALADGARLVPGNSYTVSFYLPNGEDLWKAIGEPASGYTPSSLYANILNAWKTLGCNLQVGVAFGSDSSTSSLEMTEATTLFEITPDNVSGYLGSKLSASFVCPDFKGNAYISFFFGGNTKQLLDYYFYFADVSLIDPNDSSVELKGIKGLLHNLYWNLFGGVCSEEDCPHSVESNPHLSLFDKLVNMILYLNADGTYTNPFGQEGSILDSVGEFFDKLSGYVNDSASAVTDTVDSASGMIHVFDLFTKRFSWLLGICSFTLAVIVFTRFIGL